jgi:hypothetical protein
MSFRLGPLAYLSWRVPPFNGIKPAVLEWDARSYRPLFLGLWWRVK